MRRGILMGAVLAVLAFPGDAGAAQGYKAECQTAYCGGVSEDGTRAVFPFREELTRGAERTQVYERFGGVTRALIPYPDEVPERTYTNLVGLSADARHVFVSTTLSLAPEDADGGGTDLYDVFGGAATLLSTGPLDTQTEPGFGPMAMPMSFQGASADGMRVFLGSLFEPLVPEDRDRCPDAYERFGGQTRLVTPGSAASEGLPPHVCAMSRFDGLSSDGSHVFFTADDQLVAEDEGGEDIYQRVGDALAVLTTYPENNGNCVDKPKFGDASADGATVLFSTNMPVVAADTDSTYDAYKHLPDGTYALVSRGTEGGVGPCGFGGDKPLALSADGHTAIFETVSRLAPADADSSPDLYATTDEGPMTLVTTGPTDASLDEQVFVPPAWPADVSNDATHVAFESRQRLAAADTDASVDVYLWANGQTELVSTGPLGGNATAEAELLSISGDGQTIAFATKERLTDEDTDSKLDFYLRRAGQVSRPGSASASKRSRRRTVLISAESIAPRMRVARRGRVLGSNRVAVRLRCPKAEKSGPCHGALRLVKPKGGKGAGRAAFQIAPGRSRWVSVRLRGSTLRPGRVVRTVRVRGVDRLGNRADVARRVAFISR